MLRPLLTTLIILCVTLLPAQTPSGINYPRATCVGASCPSPAITRTHITATYLDTLTETFYVAGPFRRLGGQTRIGLGSMNGSTGVLTSFAPVVDTFGRVYAMAIKGDTLFVGGRFTSINGTPRVNFAAIRISTGALLPSFNGGIGGAGDTVFAITVYNGRIYVGGKFNTVFATPRTNIARLNFNGTVNSWAPVAGGIIRKLMKSRGRVVAIADVGINNSRIIRIDTLSAAVFPLITTTNDVVFAGKQMIQDFVIHNDSVYAVGQFYEVDSLTYEEFVCCNISNGGNRPWYPLIPVEASLDTRNRLRIEIHLDNLYVLVYSGYSADEPYHALYSLPFDGRNPTPIKIYDSDNTGLNGAYGQEIEIGNSRLFEVERIALHSSFPAGSDTCKIYSWCLPVPSLCGYWVGNPYSACPSDTIWVSVQHQYYFSSYVWSVGLGNVTLVPNGDSCMVITPANFVLSSVRVRGVSSCGAQTGLRSISIAVLTAPTVSAGPDDSISCIVNAVTLHGSGSTTAPPLLWSWTGPSGFSTADSIVVTDAGTYYLQVTDGNGCRRKDSAVVFADTIPPAIVPYGSVPQLTCAQDSVILDASPLYPSDSLRWIMGAGSYPNPLVVTLPGMVYLVVTDRTNGCSSMDSVTFTQNNSPPNAWITASDTLLTCAVDSIILTGNSSATGGATFYWVDTASNQYSNPLIVDSVGVYGLYAVGNVNGCVTGPLLQIINGWFTPPNIIVATDSFNTNCSYNTVQLVASSLTSSAILAWTDSVSFTAPNPATTNQQGMYYVNVTDTINGCSAVDSAYVGFVPVLALTGVNDTVICPGSGAVLNVSPIGGTAPFTYSWNNAAGNTALVTVYPSDTLQYIVTVNDGAGCTGYDSVMVFIPDTLADSTLSFQPCDPNQPTGQVQVYPWGGIPPYQFSIDNGMTWQPSGVFTGLTFGSYQFVIQDAIGCTRNTSAVIDTNSLSPSPDFLVSTSPELGDTIVIVDISNPRPDSVVWDFPFGTVVVDSSMFAPEIIPGDTGAFDVTMHAFYGSCEVIYTRTISVQPFDSTNAQPWGNNQIDSLILYPNPNNGIFTVHTELQGKQDFVIIVTNELGIEQSRVQVSDADQWTGQMSVPNPVPGNYVLRVIAEYDSAAIVFVIAQ